MTPMAGRLRVAAFGHGDLGLTLAAVTASLVADLIAGRRRRDAACAVVAAALRLVGRPHLKPRRRGGGSNLGRVPTRACERCAKAGAPAP